MTDERLDGLAHLFVHPDITLDYDAVIDEFGKLNRRLQFC